MMYRGRELDVLSLWGEFVDLPSNLGSPLPSFLPKVKCPNPAHDTHKAHFQINTRKPFVHCFARCGIQGGYEHAVCVVLGLYDKYKVSEKDIELARDWHPNAKPEVQLAYTKVGKAKKEARRFILKDHTRTAMKGDLSAYVGQGTRKSFSKDDPVAVDEHALSSGSFQFLPKEARNYLDARGISANSRGRWQLGWHEDEERLVIPAFDMEGKFRFIIKRSLSSRGSLKYLYTEGAIKTSILFGACNLDMEQVRSIGLILVEGSLDVIRLHQLGFRNAVAILGSGLSQKQVRLIAKLNPRRVYLFFDKDTAGAENIADAKEKLTKVPLFVLRFPKHRSDPAEMTGEEVERSLTRSLPIGEFYRKARSKQTLTRRTAA